LAWSAVAEDEDEEAGLVSRDGEDGEGLAAPVASAASAAAVDGSPSGLLPEACLVSRCFPPVCACTAAECRSGGSRLRQSRCPRP
jgi:hypothetical protein